MDGEQRTPGRIGAGRLDRATSPVPPRDRDRPLIWPSSRCRKTGDSHLFLVCEIGDCPRFSVLSPVLSLILLFQTQVADAQFILQAIDGGLEHMDRARHPAALFASLHAGKLPNDLPWRESP